MLKIYTSKLLLLLLLLLLLASGFSATYFLQRQAFIAARQIQQENFDYQTREITLRIEQRLATYEQVLLGTKSLFAASNEVNRDEFRNYVENLHLENRFPGIQGVGFSLIIQSSEKAKHIQAIRKEGFPNYTVRSEGERDLYTSIIYLEPFTGRNLRAFGYDMYSEAVRRKALEQARDLDKAAISGKVKLLQETEHQVQAGFLMYVPVYRNDRPHNTLDERRLNIVGWVYAPFRMDDLMLGILGEQTQNLDLKIYDGEVTTPEALMNNIESGISPYPINTAQYYFSKKIEFAGHIWTITLHSLPIYEAKIDTNRVTVIRLAGALTTVLLTLLITLLSGGRSRALKLAELMTQELRDSEETYQLLLNSAAEAIYGIDMNGSCTFSNAACLKVLGYKHSEELLGKNMHWQIHGKYEDGTFFPVEECRIFQAFQKGVTVHVDDEVLWRADGTSFPAEYWSYPQIVNGVTMGAVVSFFDITQRKQNEAVILLAKDRAEALARAKSEFLANMSHEIRTPMNAIIGLSQLALNKALSVESRDYLEKIYSSSTSLLSILNDILDFSKLDAGRIDIDNVTFNLDVLLGNLSSLLTDLTQEKHLDFNIESASDVPRNLIGDTLRLQQVLVNLVGNAIKFTEQGSVRLDITVSHISHSQVRLLFCVTDTGIGMSDTDCEKLFQPFSQVDTSITRRFGGTGLGLVISHNLLQLMGGEISVASSPGKGSCFSFEIVFGISSVEAVKPISELVDSSNLLIGKRVLIAEDNLINQQVVGEFLKLSGIRVEIANNGKEVLTLLENGEFDAVLMDIHMPEMDGFEATRLIRSQVRFATLPIIALTAGVTKEEQEKCLAIGMNDVIAKPINPKKLFSTLINWIKPIEATTNTDKLLLKQQSGTNDLPILDLTNLLLMLGNNQKLATCLLLDFRDSMKDVPDEIEAMISAGNWVLAREKVHLIKGVSSNVGAVKLHAVTKELEAELKEGSTTATFGAFQAAFNQTMSTIGALD